MHARVEEGGGREIKNGLAKLDRFSWNKLQYTSKKTFQTVPFKRSRRDRAFCVKGPFNLNGRNGRTTAAGVELHRTRDRSVHTVVSNWPEIEQELKRVF